MLVFEKLCPDHLGQFKAFCTIHRSRLDDSFITEMEMASFCPSPSFPTMLAMEDGRVVAAASLTREDQPVSPDEWPEGVSIRPFLFDQDEETYSVIRNTSFASLKGSQTPLTVEDVAAMRHDGDRIHGGIFLLRKDGRDLGIVGTTRDPGGDGTGPMLEIGPLAVMPGHQGKRYGMLLLRHALRFGSGEAGLPRAVLCVNAENAPALGLYLREGFVVSEGFSCMRQDF